MKSLLFTRRSLSVGGFLALLCLPMQAQEKGINPMPSNVQRPMSSIRAVVVGISDYQSLPDLKFADADARAFAEWLKSPAGGSVPAEDIVLLLNEKATNARLAASLDQLIDVANEGDQIILYFSGHGDVETKTRGQFGFLLAWDSPPTNYKAGAYSIVYLQDIISTLSIDKKARVLVVTDACHAGKLAGSQIGGTQATAQALAEKFAGEVKIMSCQPNEVSLEGQQWGGGRGCFSFHLVDGLTGLADRDANGTVSLFEIGRYLEDKVPAETAPLPQMPMTVGERNTPLAAVNAEALAELLKRKQDEPRTFAGTTGRGFADGFLANLDSTTKAFYHAFETALAAGNLLDSDSSADHFYKKLLENEAAKPLHSLMRRNLAVALQDEVQQALNALLADDPYETNNWLYNPTKYKDYPRYLRRTIELLGENHYMYPTLRAKELYFEGYQIAQLVTEPNATATFKDSVRLLAKGKMLAAIALDPQAAYPYYSIGHLYWYNSPARTDSLVLWCERAIERAPNWLLPYLDVGYEYNVTMNEPEKSEPWLKKAAAINPNSYNVQERLSWLYQWLNRTEESLALSDKMIRERPDLFNAYSTAAATCILRKEFARAERYLEKSLAIEPNFKNWGNTWRIMLLAKTRRQKAAFDLSDSIFIRQGIVGDGRESVFAYLLDAVLANRQYELAAQVAEKQLKQNLVTGYLADAEDALGIAQIKKGNFPEGLSWLQKACKSAPHHDAPLLMLRQYAAIIAEKEGHISRADSLFRAACGYRLSSLSMDNRLVDYTASLREDYAQFLLRQNRPAEATEQIQKLLEEEPNSWRGYLCMAVFHAQKGEQNAALDWLEKAFDRWLPTPELATEEPLFSKIRKTKRFKALMLKHFPSEP